MTDHTVVLPNNLTIFYRLYSSSSSTASSDNSYNSNKKVLCLHGWLDNLESFAVLAPHIAKHATCVACDFPGHGRSSHRSADSQYSHDNNMSFVYQLIVALGWASDKITLIGHSMGGNVALRFAGMFPQQVSSVISLDASGGRGYENASAMIKHLQKYLTESAARGKLSGNKLYASMKECIERHQQGDINKDIAYESSVLLCKGSVVEGQGGYYFGHDPRLKEYVAQAPTEVVVALLQAIEAKVLLVVAEKSPMYDHGLRVHYSKTTTIVGPIPASHHHLHMEERFVQQFRDKMIEFIL